MASDKTATPAGVIVEARLPDGTVVNVTEGVQTLYDLVLSSMDWGSGFLTLEDALPVAHIARTCGFAGIDEAERYVAQEQHNEEQKAFWAEDPERSRLWYPAQPHQHVYSQALGRCMWRGCGVKQEESE